MPVDIWVPRKFVEYILSKNGGIQEHLSPIDLSRILEHLPGEHDQKSHGNWAQGTKSSSADYEKQLLSDPMKPSNLKAQTGINKKAFIAEMENGKKAYVKNILRGKTASEHEAYAEIAAYDLDQELEFGIVPQVVIRNDLQGHPGFQGHPEDKGQVIVSEWVNNATTVQDLYISDTMIEASPKLNSDFENMMVLDLVMANEDRHSRQMMIYNDGINDRLAAIDHGISFYDDFNDPFTGDYMETEDWMGHYLYDKKDMWSGFISNNKSLEFDLSSTGPWQQVVDQRFQILNTIGRSLQRGGMSQGRVAEIVKGVDERIEIIGYWLDEGDLESFNEVVREHLPGEHDQKTHGRRNGQQDNDYLWRSGNVTILKGKKGRLGNRGISKARKATLEDGTVIIYKQQLAERIKDGYTGKEEETYYVVATEYFDAEGVVPKTVYRDDGYIAQEFVGDATSVASHGTFKMGKKPKGGEVPRDPQPLRNIVVMDMVMGNTDRHPGNVLLDNKTGKAYAIDNDASFYPGRVIISGGEVNYIMDRSVMTLSKINNNERKWLDFSIKKVNPAYFSGLSSKDVTPRRQDILKGIEVINNPKFKSYIMTTLGEGAWEQTELRKVQMQEIADKS